MKVLTIFQVVMLAALLGLAAAWPANAGPLVYVPLGDEGKIVAIDGATDKTVGEIGAVPSVHGLAITPDGRYLIAGSFEERARSNGVPEKPAGVSAADHAAHHGGGRSGLSKQSGIVSSVTIIRSADRIIVRRIDVPGAVHHVTTSPDGRFAVVTHPNEGTVSVIDLGTFRVRATLATGPLPNYAVFSPDSGKLYVSNTGNDTVSIVDTGRWIVAGNIVVGGSPEHLALSQDGATLYVNNVSDGVVSVIDAGSRKVVKTIPVGTTLHGIDLSDDGKTLFVVALGDDKVVRVDLASGNRSNSSLTPAPYHLAAIRRSGKLYVTSAEAPKVWVVDQRDLRVIGEIPIGGKGHQIVQGPAR